MVASAPRRPSRRIRTISSKRSMGDSLKVSVRLRQGSVNPLSFSVLGQFDRPLVWQSDLTGLDWKFRIFRSERTIDIDRIGISGFASPAGISFKRPRTHQSMDSGSNRTERKNDREERS